MMNPQNLGLIVQLLQSGQSSGSNDSYRLLQSQDVEKVNKEMTERILNIVRPPLINSLANLRLEHVFGKEWMSIYEGNRIIADHAVDCMFRVLLRDLSPTLSKLHVTCRDPKQQTGGGNSLPLLSEEEKRQLEWEYLNKQKARYIQPDFAKQSPGILQAAHALSMNDMMISQKNIVTFVMEEVYSSENVKNALETLFLKNPQTPVKTKSSIVPFEETFRQIVCAAAGDPLPAAQSGGAMNIPGLMKSLEPLKNMASKELSKTVNSAKDMASKELSKTVNSAKDMAKEGLQQQLNSAKDMAKEGLQQQLNSAQNAAKEGLQQQLNSAKDMAKEDLQQQLNSVQDAAKEGLQQQLNSAQNAAKEGLQQQNVSASADVPKVNASPFLEDIVRKSSPSSYDWPTVQKDVHKEVKLSIEEVVKKQEKQIQTAFVSVVKFYLQTYLNDDTAPHFVNEMRQLHEHVLDGACKLVTEDDAKRILFQALFSTPRSAQSWMEALQNTVFSEATLPPDSFASRIGASFFFTETEFHALWNKYPHHDPTVQIPQAAALPVAAAPKPQFDSAELTSSPDIVRFLFEYDKFQKEMDTILGGYREQPALLNVIGDTLETICADAFSDPDELSQLYSIITAAVLRVAKSSIAKVQAADNVDALVRRVQNYMVRVHANTKPLVQESVREGVNVFGMNLPLPLTRREIAIFSAALLYWRLAPETHREVNNNQTWIQLLEKFATVTEIYPEETSHIRTKLGQHEETITQLFWEFTKMTMAANSPDQTNMYQNSNDFAFMSPYYPNIAANNTTTTTTTTTTTNNNMYYNYGGGRGEGKQSKRQRVSRMGRVTPRRKPQHRCR